MDSSVAPGSAGWLPWGLLGSICVLAAVLGLAWLRQWRRGRGLGRRLRAATSELDDLRQRDSLTGLPTRVAFERALADAVAQADAGGGTVVVLHLGLDNFRPVNDGYGHRVGDALLREAARRLEAQVAPPLALCRMGGDEFAIMVPGADGDAARRRAQALVDALARPYACEGLELRVGASVGFALYPDHGGRPRLVPHAALAMRSVKLAGGDGIACYDPSMAVDLRGQAELLQDLRRAVERGQLQLVYQPKIDATSLQVTAVEALLRWQHPTRGMVSPAIFVPLAERHGLISAIGRWVFAEACRQAGEWRARGLRMRVAVNLSGQQLRHEDFVPWLEGELRRHAIPPGRFTVEITESVAMEGTEATRAAFERLRQAGLDVSIDDFGTGYSSLATLRQLPAAELKIDRAFVTDLPASEDAVAIARAIVQMASTLGLRVVAEGVETEGQRDALLAMGCHELQGYLFAKPMSAQSLALWADGDVPGPAGTFRPSLFDPTAPMPLDGPR
jgi:diguanylate cyclase (GGDEF)-like protein